MEKNPVKKWRKILLRYCSQDSQDPNFHWCTGWAHLGIVNVDLKRGKTVEVHRQSMEYRQSSWAPLWQGGSSLAPHPTHPRYLHTILGKILVQHLISYTDPEGFPSISIKKSISVYDIGDTLKRRSFPSSISKIYQYRRKILDMGILYLRSLQRDALCHLLHRRFPATLRTVSKEIDLPN